MTRDQIGTTVPECGQISTFAEEIWRSHGGLNPNGGPYINGPPHDGLGNHSEIRQFGLPTQSAPVAVVPHVNQVSGPNRDQIRTRSIPLTQGSIALIDEADYEEVSKYRWYAHRDKGTGRFYAQRNIPKGAKQTTQSLHRFLLGNPPLLVDHIDGDTLNCRRSNLRACTFTQNVRNRSKNKGKDLPKGVIAHPGGWFRAVVTKGKRQYFLGLYRNPVSAGFAYDRKSRELFGEFARPNFAPLPVIWRGA